MCAACVVARRHVALWEAGYVLIEKRHRQAFLDCGITVETICADQTCWAPCWAEQIRDLFMGTWDLGPILVRSAVDSDFVEALITVKTLEEQRVSRSEERRHAEQKRLVASRVRAFAIAQGVQLRQAEL